MWTDCIGGLLNAVQPKRTGCWPCYPKCSAWRSAGNGAPTIPAKALSAIRRISGAVTYSADELARLGRALDEYSDQQSADIFRLLLLTGARRGEVLAARWADFDPEFKTWRKPASATKQKLEHSVPLSEPARVLLTKIRREVAAGEEWVFPGYAGEHRKVVWRAWLAICTAAEITGVRIHDLRHSFASVLASAGHSLPVIGALLGHSVPTTTARYAHLYDDPLRAATEAAGKVITGGNDRH